MRRLVLSVGALLVATAAAAQPKPTPNLLPDDVRIRFETADRDDSGNLTKDEAVKGGYSSNAFAAVDTDGDQIVTVTEIGTYLAERTSDWVKADRDNDGTITRDEAEGSPTIKSVFSNADSDSDGILRKQEHEAWAQTSLYQNVDLPVVVPNIINKKF